MKVDGVEVTLFGVELSDEEIKVQVAYAKEQMKGKKLLTLTIKPHKDTEELALVWEAQGVKFERIRRITGKPTK